MHYFLKKDSLEYLSFGLICIVMAARTLIIGNFYIHHAFPGISWQILNKAEAFSTPMLVIFFLSYTDKIYLKTRGTGFSKIVYFASLIYRVLTLLTPATVYSLVRSGFGLIVIASGV